MKDLLVDTMNKLIPAEHRPDVSQSKDTSLNESRSTDWMPAIFIGMIVLSTAVSGLLYFLTEDLLLSAGIFALAIFATAFLFIIKVLFPTSKTINFAHSYTASDIGTDHLLMDSLPYAIWISDLKGRIISGNSLFNRWTHNKWDQPIKMIKSHESDGHHFLIDTIKDSTTFQGCLELAFPSRNRRVLISAIKKQDRVYWSAFDVQSLPEAIENGIFYPEGFQHILSFHATAYVILSSEGLCFYASEAFNNLVGQSSDDAPFVDYDLKSQILHTQDGRTLKSAIVEHHIGAHFPSPLTGKFVFFTDPLQAPEVEASNVSDEMAAILQHKLFIKMPLAMAVINDEREIVATNERFKQSFGRQGDIGKVKHLVCEEDQVNFINYIKPIISGGDQLEPFNVHYNTDNSLEGQVYATHYQGQNDENYAVLFCLDKTVEKNLEQQFVQAQKMQAVGQLAGGVAHDFNNLLTAIIGFCDLLLMRHAPGDNSFADINQIKQNANRAANLVRQLLAFSRQQTLRPKALNITDVLSDVSNLIRRLIGENIVFSLNLKRDLPMVRADQGQLEQVVMNLAVNARDAMKGAGTLDIITRFIQAGDQEILNHNVIENTDYVVIDVKDTGTGMSKEVQEKIFDPFFTTKAVGEGTGLGLSTVYGIIKQTGGYIFVDSTEGQGTTFSIYLPVQDVTAFEVDDKDGDESDPSDKNKDLSGKGCVLLVEDEDPVRMFATRALENKGYKVLEADSGETALEILNQHDHTIDLLITDVIMPIVDGPTLFKHARAINPNLPVIFISGYAEDIIRKDLEGGDFDFLAKPFSLVDLAEKVKLILD